MPNFILGILIFICLEQNVLISVVFWILINLIISFLSQMFLKYLSNMNRIKSLTYDCTSVIILHVNFQPNSMSSYLGANKPCVILHCNKVSEISDLKEMAVQCRSKLHVQLTVQDKHRLLRPQKMNSCDQDNRLMHHEGGDITVEQFVVHTTMNVDRANVKYRAKFLCETGHIQGLKNMYSLSLKQVHFIFCTISQKYQKPHYICLAHISPNKILL